MSGDPKSGNEEDLLNQIDELKARMDRLMSGGTSTSNSALLTDKPEAKAPAEAPVAPPPGPNRTRVRDLIESEDSEIIESYPGPKEVVSFPGDEKPEESPAVPLEEHPTAAPESEPEPVSQARPVGGSVIPMEADPKEVRPRVSSFDDLGSAIQKELAKDASVPPAEAKKGPDLASRFGPAEATTAPAVQEAAPVEDELVDDEDLDAESEAEVEDTDLDEPVVVAQPRSNAGKVAAVWAITAIASGAIAALHFMGVI